MTPSRFAAGVVLGALTGCAPSVQSACRATHAGEPVADVVARLAGTGATHYPGRAAPASSEHKWVRFQRIGLGAELCYVHFDERGLALDARYHEGN